MDSAWRFSFSHKFKTIINFSSHFEYLLKILFFSRLKSSRVKTRFELTHLWDADWSSVVTRIWHANIYSLKAKLIVHSKSNYKNYIFKLVIKKLCSISWMASFPYYHLLLISCAKHPIKDKGYKNEINETIWISIKLMN